MSGGEDLDWLPAGGAQLSRQDPAVVFEMTKPRGVKWLEEQTGEVLDRPGPRTPPGEGRHLSVRLPGDLVAKLEDLASDTGETVSQVTRRLITEGVARVSVPDRAALDVAITALQRLRKRLDSPAA